MTSLYKKQQLQLGLQQQLLPQLQHQLQEFIEILEQDFNGDTYVVNTYVLRGAIFCILIFFKKQKKSENIIGT